LRLKSSVITHGVLSQRTADKEFYFVSNTLVSEVWNIHHESREAEEEQVMFDSDGILGQHYLQNYNSSIINTCYYNRNSVRNN
jgi:hypothetical protein